MTAGPGSTYEEIKAEIRELLKLYQAIPDKNGPEAQSLADRICALGELAQEVA